MSAQLPRSTAALPGATPTRGVTSGRAIGSIAVGLATSVVTGCASHGHLPPARTLSVQPSRLTESCDTPTTRFTRFWELATGSVDYSGTVPVAGADIPALSMYVSRGPAGSGTLCVSSAARIGAEQPIQATAVARPGAIAYLNSAQGQPFGAVRPGVSRVTISAQNNRAPFETFTLDGDEQESRLQDLGAGWHAFNSAYAISVGQSISATLTVHAYSTGNQVLDTVVFSLRDGAAPSDTPSA